MKPITILEVVDNFFGDELPDFKTLPEHIIEDFGKEVRRFSESYEPPSINDKSAAPSFLGGWPSARWFEFSPLIMTSLLYSGQTLIKDTLIDWFSDEQYELKKVVEFGDIVVPRAQSGYRVVDADAESRLSVNRHFLHRLIPALLRARPLIEAEIIVLAPAKKFEYNHADRAESLADSILNLVVNDPRKFTREFRPIELPISDLQRGLFIIPQTSNVDKVELHIKSYVREALYYLCMEYLFSSDHSFTYTSTFQFEEYVCHNGISQAIKSHLSSTGQKVYQGILYSQLPLYQNLTPGIIASIHDDDNYAAFRRDLHQTYGNLSESMSNSERRKYIREAEEALLRPTLQQLEQEVSKGLLAKAGFSKLDVMRLAFTVLVGSTTGMHLDKLTSLGILGEVIQKLLEKKTEQNSVAIWKKLYRHSRSFTSEFNVDYQKGTSNKKLYWGVELKDSLKYTVTEGMRNVPEFVGN